MDRSRRSIAWLATLAAVVVLQVPSRALAAAPTNDLIAGATSVASLPFSEPLDYLEATHSDSDPSSCILDPHGVGFKTLWYVMTPSASDRIGVTVPGYVGVDVFTGSPGTLTKVACHTYSFTFQPEFRFDPTPGTQYYIMISVPANWSASFPITLDVAPAGPSNDDFDSATVVDSLDFTDTVDASNAIEWLDDPECLYWRAQHTVWYRYTPPADAGITVDTVGSEMEGAIGVFTGERGDLASVVECDYYIYGEQPSVTTLVQGGATYYVMVGTVAEGLGQLTFNFHARLLSSITLAASHQVVRFGESVELSGHLDGFEAGTTPTVSIARRPSTVPIAFNAVDENGDFSVGLKPTENSTYEASWSGDATYEQAKSSHITVEVQIVLRTRMAGFYSRSGPYHLFHRTADPRYAVAIVPNHRGETVLLQLQHYKSGSWRPRASAGFDLNRYSKLMVSIDHRALVVGRRYRIRTVFKSDADHVGATADWSYFRLTA